MESDRVHARARDHARGVDCEDAPTPSAAGSTGCATAASSRIDGRRHARARPPHPRRGRDARRRLRRRDVPEARGARAGRRRAVDGRAPTSRATVTPARAVRPRRRRARAWSRSTTASSARSCASSRERGAARRRCCPARRRRRRAARRDPDARLPRQRPRRPGARSTTSSTTVRELLGADAGVRHLPRPPAARAARSGLETFKLPFGHRGANHPVQGPARPAAIAITAQNHGFAVGPAASASSDEPVAGRPTSAPPSSAREPLRRHGRGPRLPDVRARLACSTTPRPGPGPHDAWHLFDRFVGAARCRA